MAKSNKRPVPARLSRLLALLLLACIEVNPANQTKAATLTWTGAAGNGNLLSSTNWSPAQAPVTGDILIFAGSTSLVNTLGSSALSVASLTFNAASGSFVLNGTNTLAITGAAGITTSATVSETLSTNISLGIAQTWTSNTGGSLIINGNVANTGYTLTLSGAGTHVLNGIVSGSGGLVKSSVSGSTILLNAANTYTGATNLGTGLTQIGNNAAFGTGVVTFSSKSTLIEAYGSARTVANNYVFGNTTTFQGANDLTFTGNGSMTASRQIYVNGTGIVTLNGALSGAGGVSKYGTGVLVLNGNNTNTAGVSLNGGTLIAGGSNAFGTGTISLGSGTLQTQASALTFANSISLTGNTIFAGDQNITFNGNAVLTGSRTLTNNSTGTVTYNGAISGAYYLYKKGTGNLVYGGASANTYSGLTRSYDGGLVLGKSVGVNAVAGALTIGDGVGNANSAFVQLNNANQIIDSSAVTLYGDGQLRLQNYNDNIGALTLYGGSISGTGTLGLGNNLTFAVSGSIPGTIDAGLSLNSARIFNIGDNTNLATELTINGAIADGIVSSGISKTGTGNLALNGANTFTGGLAINAGSVLAGANGALGTALVNLGDTTGTATASLLFGTTSGLNIANGIVVRSGSTGTLTLGGSNTSGVNLFSSAISLARSVSLTAAAGGQVDFGGTVSGPGGIIKIGAGTIKLNAANSYAGGTVISAGTLLLGVNDALGNGSVTVSAGTLDLGINRSATIGALTLTSGSILGSGTSSLTTASAISLNSGIISLSLAGAGTLTKIGTGTVVVSGANIFTGATAITAGTFTAGAANTFSPNSAVTISTGAVLSLQSYNNTVASLAGTGNVSLGAGVLTVGGSSPSSTFTGVISGIGGLTKNGTGSLIIGGVNTYTGATAINGGTLQFGVGDAINPISALAVAGSSTLSLSGFSGTFGSIAGSGNISEGSGSLAFGADNSSTDFSGVISGTGTTTKNGTGTTTLTGSNTITGPVVLTNGTTSLAGANGSLASVSSITLRTGATLNLDNSTTENANRIGNTTGITLNGGSFRLSSDSNGSWETVGALTVATGNSLVQVVHNGGLGTNSRLTFSSLGTIAAGATVNFLGAGGILGFDTWGPQIFITGQANGLLGSWATVGADAAEYTIFGVRAYSDYYEGSLGLNYQSTGKIVRLTAVSPASAYILTGLGQTTDLGLNLTDISEVNLGNDSLRTLNLTSGSLIKSTSTSTTISGGGSLTAGGTSAGTLAISVTGGSSLAVSSVIANNSGAAIGLSKADAGSLTLSGANTFSGNVFLNGGTTHIANESNLGAATNDITFNGGILHLTSGFTTSAQKNFTILGGQSGTFDIDSAQTLTLSSTAGVLSSGNALSTLIKTGAGSLVVGGTNSGFTGLLQISQGRVELRQAQSLAGPIALVGGTLALVANASTNFGDSLQILADSSVAVDRLSGSGAVVQTLGAVNLGAVNWTISGSNAASLTVGTVNLTGAGNFVTTTADLTVGVVSGSFGLLKSGAGTLSLSAPGTYLGATQINAGVLRQSLANALPVNTDLSVSSGGSFDLANVAATTGSLSGAGNVLLGSGFLSTGTNSSTFSGVLSGSGGLVKIGSGTLTLSGINSFTGATVVTAGTLAVSGRNRLSESTDINVTSGATFSLANNNTAVASLSGNGSIFLGSGTFTTGANSSSFGGTISGSGGLAKTSSGTLTLTGVSTYTGLTTISAGNLVVRDSAALGSAVGGISLATGAELRLENNIYLPAKTLTTSGILRNSSGSNGFGGNIALSGSASIVSDSGTFELSGPVALAGNSLGVSGTGITWMKGVISGSGNLAKSGAGLLHLSGNNTYSGGSTVSSGTLQIASTNALGATGGNNATSVAHGAVLLIDEEDGLSVSAETLNLSGTLRSASGQNTWNGPINLTDGGIVEVASDLLNIEGDIADSGGSRSLTKTGNGVLVLSGKASHTGGTFIAAGTLRIDASDRLLSTGAVNVSAAATLDLDDNELAVGSIAGSGFVQTGPTSTATGGGTLTVGAGNISASFSGTLQGAGDLAKVGSATQILASASTFTGGTTINGGKLEATVAGALGSTASIQINAGGTLLLSGASTTDRINNIAAIALNGGTLERSAGSEGVGRNRSIGGSLSGRSSVGLGVLTLTANSSIDFGTGAVGTLTFTGFNANGFTLNLQNYTWSGNGAYNDGQSDRLLFDADQSSNLSRFNFGSGVTAFQVNLGDGFYEVTAVPEPATWLGGLGLVGLTLSQLRRRRARGI